jgi:formaldehyde-activating enzyme involved in methanogenesis
LLLLVAVWVDPDAHDETAVRVANREATRAALADALNPPSAAEVRALAEQRAEASNAYYTGE